MRIPGPGSRLVPAVWVRASCVTIPIDRADRASGPGQPGRPDPRYGRLHPVRDRCSIPQQADWCLSRSTIPPASCGMIFGSIWFELVCWAWTGSFLHLLHEIARALVSDGPQRQAPNCRPKTARTSPLRLHEVARNRYHNDQRFALLNRQSCERAALVDR